AFSVGARAGLRLRRSSTSIAAAMAVGWTVRALVEFGEDLLAEDVNPFALIAADVVQVDAIKAEVDELLDLTTVGIDVGRDQHPAFEVFGSNNFGHLLEIER